MEKFLEQIENKLVASQVAKYIKEHQYIKALNFVWPLALKNKENIDLNLLLGIIYCHAEKNEQAKAQLNKVLSIRPDQFLPRYYLVRVFIQENNYDCALSELEVLLNYGYEDERVYQGIAALRKKLRL